MKINKILIGIWILLMTMTSVSALIEDNLYVHHEFDDATDSSGNGRTGTLTSGSYVAGKVGNGVQLNALGEYFTTATLTGVYDTDATICAWLSNDDATAYLGYSVNTGHGGTSNVLNLGLNSNVIGYNDGAWHNSAQAYSTGYHYTCWVFDDSESKFEIHFDNTNLGNFTYGGLIDFKGVFTLSRASNQDLSGIVDEFSIWTEKKSKDELSCLYNSNSGLTFSSWSTCDPGTPEINHNLSAYYNVTSISVSVNTISNVNMSYSLDGGGLVSICNDCNSSSIVLNSLSEQNHSIDFKSVDIGGVAWTNTSFIVDLTKPNIQIIGNITQDTFEVDFSTIFNVTDNGSGVKNCTLNITYLTEFQSDSNFLINCTDTQIFTRSGLYNGFLKTFDNAENYNSTSINGTINALTYVNHAQPNGSLISNYSALIYHPSGDVTSATFVNETTISISPINNGTLDFGNHTIVFSKIGYQTTNNTIDINATSGGETHTFEVQISELYINIRDRTTEALITQTVDFDLVGVSYASAYSTITGLKTITDILELPGTYRLTFTSNDYADTNYYFTHTGYAPVNITTYLVNSSLTIPVKIILRDIFSNPMKFTDDDGEEQGCIIKVKQYYISSNDYIIVDMGTTNTLGEVIFDMEFNEYYQFVIDCDGVIQTESGQKITSTPIYIQFDANEALTIFDELPNLAGEVTFDNLSNTTGYFRFEYDDKDNIASQGCLYVYEIKFSGNILINSSCVNSPSATINVNLPFVTNKQYLGQGFVTYQNKDYFIDEYIKSFLPNSTAWSKGMGLWSAFLLIGVLFLIGVGRHPFAGIGFAWLGTFVSVLIGALGIGEATITGIGIFILGIILLRRTAP